MYQTPSHIKLPSRMIPLSDTEKAMKRAGIGKMSGYWRDNSYHRRHMADPLSNDECRTRLYRDWLIERERNQ